jgi:DnaK suppressor protein
MKNKSMKINHALRRIEGGVFGICELTGHPIEQERLKAEPWTRYCAAAQHELELQGISARAFAEGERPYAGWTEIENVENDMKGDGEDEPHETNG